MTDLAASEENPWRPGDLIADFSPHPQVFSQLPTVAFHAEGVRGGGLDALTVDGQVDDQHVNMRNRGGYDV